VDSLNKNVCTPLHLATQNSHGKAIQTLLKFKADTTILNQVKITKIYINNIIVCSKEKLLYTWQ